MSDPDPLPRPPRRRINGVTWVYKKILCASSSGCYGMSVGLYSATGILEIRICTGYAMGCVKDDDGTLPDRFTEEAG
jgi:hypothetical protein